jgi:MFS superfamily sulfate permease-like transporter
MLSNADNLPNTFQRIPVFHSYHMRSNLALHYVTTQPRSYNVVGFLGTKRVTYKQALAAVFVEGFIFLAISVSGVRGRLVELIPRHIMYATAAGTRQAWRNV